MESNYYEVLGVKASAKDEEIKQAFKNLAKVYHPDKNPGDKSYEEQFKKINEAYQVLSDNSKRFFYDIKLESRNSGHSAEAAPTPAPFTRSTRKNSNGVSGVTLGKEMVEKKVWIFSAAGAVVLIAGVFVLYHFMNRYAAKKSYEEGLVLEKKRNFIGAMEKFSESIESDKKLTDAYIHRALLRISCLGDFQGGLYDLKQAMLNAEKPSSLPYYYQAKVHRRLKQYDEAITNLDMAIAEDPKMDSAYFLKAEIESNVRKNYSLAILHYSKSIALNSSFAPAYFGRGFAQQQVKSNREAIEDFDKAISLNKDQASWYYYRAVSRLALKKKKQACDDYSLAVAKGFEEVKKDRRRFCR